jgi:hypothetical protein
MDSSCHQLVQRAAIQGSSARAKGRSERVKLSVLPKPLVENQHTTKLARLLFYTPIMLVKQTVL